MSKRMSEAASSFTLVTLALQDGFSISSLQPQHMVLGHMLSTALKQWGVLQNVLQSIMPRFAEMHSHSDGPVSMPTRVLPGKLPEQLLP